MGRKPTIGLPIGLAVGALLLRRAQRMLRLRLALGDNVKLLSGSERRQSHALLSSSSHRHLLRGWPRAGVRDAEKHRLLRCAASGAAADTEAARLALLAPPKTLQRPKTLEAHGDRREDPYYWLRDDSRQDPEVLAHLKAEAEYARAVLADTEDMQESLYREMRARIKEDDDSVPVRHKGHFYYVRTLEGQQYCRHCRRRVPPGAGPPTETEVMGTEGAPEEVVLDEDAEAAAHPFYDVGAVAVSPDERLVAWTEDTVGSEKFAVRVRALAGGRDLAHLRVQGSGDVAWANDSNTLYWVMKDELDRPRTVWRYEVAGQGAPVQVYDEADGQFHLGLDRSRSEQLLYIHSGSSITSETRVLRASEPRGAWTPLLPRQHDVEYSVSHRPGHFFLVLRDKDRPNSELLVAPEDHPERQEVLLPHRSDVKLEAVVTSARHLAVFERKEGLVVATVFDLPSDGSAPTALGSGRAVPFPEQVYSLRPGSCGDFASPVLRLVYSSLAVPPSTVDFNMATGARATKKVAPVLGGFDAGNYATRRLWATAPDGARVPVSLVHHRTAARLDGSDPLLLDGYGAYEASIDPSFSRNKLTLIDRGFIYAIAHVRGGGEMGRAWYEQGKYLQKRNTFLDFIAAAEALVQQGLTRPDRLCIEGRSAGGLTIAAALNLRPDLFAVAYLGVPFVDCLTTMLDPSIPLTEIEWEEWGNPQDKEYYNYMKSYAPYENIRRTRYPHILVTAGLHDQRVGYWEPAKYVARLRAAKTDDNLLLFKCDLGAGHFSQSGRFDALKEVALETAFLFKALGMLEAARRPVLR